MNFCTTNWSGNGRAHNLRVNRASKSAGEMLNKATVYPVLHGHFIFAVFAVGFLSAKII